MPGNLINNVSQIRLLQQLQRGENEMAAGWAGPNSVARTVADRFQDSISAADVGCRDDGADCLALLQGLIDEVEAAGGGIINLPRRDGGFYNLSGPLALKTGVYLRGWGAGCLLKNAAEESNNRQSHVFMAGTYHPAYFNDLTTYACADVTTAGGFTVTTSTASHAGNFTAGDIIFLRSDAKYFGAGNHERPDFQLQAVVVSAVAGTGVITLDAPIDEAVTSPKIAKMNDSGVALSSTPYDTLYAPRPCGLLNLSVESVDGPVTELGGAIGLMLDIHEWTGQDGVFVNALARANIHIRRLKASRKCMDFSGGSHFCQIRVDDMQYTGVADPGLSCMIISENSRRNRFSCGTYHGGIRAAGDALVLKYTRGNHVQIDNFIAPSEISNVITVTNQVQDDAGETQPVSNDNTLSFGEVVLGSCARFYYIPNVSGVPIARNRLLGGKFRGTASSAGIGIGNDDNYVDPSVDVGANAVVISSDCTNLLARGLKAGSLTDNAGAASNLYSLASGDVEKLVDMPVGGWDAMEGTPALTSFASRYRGWAMDGTATESIYAAVRVPAGYTKMSAYVYAVSTSNTDGNARWNLAVGPFADGEDTNVASSSAALTTAYGDTNYLIVAHVGTVGIAVTAGDLAMTRIQRLGGDALDTLDSIDVLITHVVARFFN